MVMFLLEVKAGILLCCLDERLAPGLFRPASREQVGMIWHEAVRS
jgi:hypothetical protein